MKQKLWAGLIKALLVAAIVGSCGEFPKDPDHSFQKAREEGLRVGVINDPPWARMEGGLVTGREVEIIQTFAEKHHMQVEWIPGAEHNLMLALEESELHFLIGGITKDSPYKEFVGFTNPHCKEEIVICGIGEDAEIRNREVGVRRGSGVGAHVRRKGGIPVYVDSLEDFPGPVVASRRECEPVDHLTCSKPIKTRHHVIAVAKGENQLLIKLEEHINETGRR